MGIPFALRCAAQPSVQGESAMEGLFAVGGIVLVIFLVLAIATSIFWIWMLIDALTNEPTTEQKLLWFLVIFFLHFLGALIYFFVRRSSRAQVPG
jgi:sterol desaturase/sphingolipid hydroxylase (fatty acid hydroxylase superfamily)